MSLPGSLAGPFTAAEQVGLALAGAAAVTAVAILGYRAWKRSRVPPEELERRRRELLVASGKMGDAMLVEIRDEMLFYAYLVRGVEYTASQDVSRLKDRIPEDLSSIGPVAVRYDSRNPANSIVIAEKWSGLRLGESFRK
jgi:hypothetical protein